MIAVRTRGDGDLSIAGGVPTGKSLKIMAYQQIEWAQLGQTVPSAKAETASLSQAVSSD
jgi:hypothetical protein